MVRGRTTGTTNKSAGHKAGGVRQGAGRPRARRDAHALLRLQQHTLRAFSVLPLPNVPPRALLGDETAALLDDTEEPVPTMEEQEKAAVAAEEVRASAALEQKNAEARQYEVMRQTMIEKLRQATADGSLDAVLECLPGNQNDGEESDDEFIEDGAVSNAHHAKRNSSAYKPPDGSTLHSMLNTIKNQVISDSTIQSLTRKQYTSEGSTGSCLK